MKRYATVMLFIICSVLFLSCLPAQSAPVQPLPAQAASGSHRKIAVSPNEIKLNSTLRNLFIKCLNCQRTLAVKTLAGAQDTQQAQDNLTAAINKIGVVFKTYYGDASGGQITTLFSQYIQLTADYAGAVKNGGDKAAVAGSMQSKSAAIVGFLNSLSPSWAKNRLSEALNKYSDVSMKEIDMEAKSLGKPDVNAFSATFKQTSELAVAFTVGIARQFPKQFQQ